jgi:3-hydroxy-9,10-secoandrosta-1,3,5(10)-triene-9,17-dione monooxygenase
MNTFIAEVIDRSAAMDYNRGLVEGARSVVPILQRNAAETEANRVVHPENIQALRDAGLLTINLPRRFGGPESNLRTFVEVTAELARGCASTAWVSSLHNGAAFLVALFDDEAQQDVWGVNPQAQFCCVFSSNPTVTSKKVPGGWRVSGTWGFASGSLHADWALTSFPVVDEDGATIDQGLSLMPMENFTIKDTWFVAGMRGTGSNTLVAEDMFVPEHRVLSLVKAVDGVNNNHHQAETVYQSAWVPYLFLSVMAPMLGMVQQGIEYIDELLAKNKVIQYANYESARLSPAVQLTRAAAQVDYDSAWLHARHVATVVDEAAAAGVYPDFAVRIALRANIAAAMRLLRTSMDHLLDIGGAGSFAESSRLQRAWRDLEVSSRHGALNTSIVDDAYGRFLVGVPDSVTPLI